MDENGTLIFITVLLFVGMLLSMIGLYYYLQRRRDLSVVMKRVKQVDESQGGNQAEEGINTVKNSLIRFIGSLGALAKPKDEQDISHLRKTFLRAGIRKENGPMIFFGAKVFLAILLPTVFSLVKLMIIRPIPSIYTMFLAILLATIGFYLPGLWLRMRIKRRKEKVLEGLPEALDMMVVCVEAGMGLDAAINRVGEEIKLSNKVVGEEFRTLSLELRAGKQRKDALKNLSMRTDLEDLSSLVTLLIQTERFGTSIAQALRVHSDTMRVRRQQRAEEIAAKLPVKLIFPLMVFIFPSLFVIILGPAVIRIIRILLPTLTRG
jgi:tight adherence protein C